MMIGASYESKAREWIELYTSRAESGPRSFGVLLGELLARWLAAEPLDALRGDAEARLSAPVAHRRAMFVPLVGLEQALLAAALGSPSAPLLHAAREAIDAAADDAVDSEQRRRVTGWAVAVAAWLGDKQMLARWTREREALSPFFPVAETAILSFAALERAGAAPLSPALDAMLAIHAADMLSDYQVLLATAVIASAERAGHSAGDVLARGRALVDADLWPHGDPYKPRATFVPATWSLEQGVLRATVEVAGEGGRIRAVAPFMQPLYTIVAELDALLGDEDLTFRVTGMRSKAQARKLLADPGSRVELHYAHTGQAFLERDDVIAYQPVANTIAEWLSVRRPGGFRARLSLTV
jgi:hypothetical protein